MFEEREDGDGDGEYDFDIPLSLDLAWELHSSHRMKVSGTPPIPRSDARSGHWLAKKGSFDMPLARDG